MTLWIGLLNNWVELQSLMFSGSTCTEYVSWPMTNCPPWPCPGSSACPSGASSEPPTSASSSTCASRPRLTSVSGCPQKPLRMARSVQVLGDLVFYLLGHSVTLDVSFSENVEYSCYSWAGCSMQFHSTTRCFCMFTYSSWNHPACFSYIDHVTLITFYFINQILHSAWCSASSSIALTWNTIRVTVRLISFRLKKIS